MDSSPSFTSTPLRRIELTPAPDGPNPIATLPVTKTDKQLLEELRTKAEVEGGTCGYPFVSNSYVAPTDEMFDSDGNLLYVPDITGIMIQQHSDLPIPARLTGSLQDVVGEIIALYEERRDLGKQEFFKEDLNPGISRLLRRLHNELEKKGYKKSGTDFVETFDSLAYYLSSRRETLVIRMRAVVGEAEEPMDTEVVVP